MPDDNSKPIIFLAFSCPVDENVIPLRKLSVEKRQLRDALKPAEEAGLCEVIVRSDCTAGDIFKIFQHPKCRNRIGIFHYAGHANSYQLLLEAADGSATTADGAGLAAFLGQQRALNLVFLNGCSTLQQTQGLLAANVSAVISTSRDVVDAVATDFATQFYQGLAGAATIRTAFQEAQAGIQMQHGSETRKLYFGSKNSGIALPETGRWPWEIFQREGSERADQWNLPEAANDPLFGLPELPAQDLPEIPYRQLSWFERQHADIFFGRGRQIRELYDRLTAPRSAPIVLFYGQSGVGKSSILSAGLLPRLEQDYEVHYRRRTKDGLTDTLAEALPPAAVGESLAAAWNATETQLGKPLVIILDQVEELYTRPIVEQPDELNDFLSTIATIFANPHNRPQGKLVLGFRKEWLAELETELSSHTLPRSRVFLEPLDRSGIIEVVRGPTTSQRLSDHYRLQVQGGLPDVIADDLLADRDSAIAPTLQILLGKMWAKATEDNYETPTFTTDLYQQLKRDGILLRDFLNQQIVKFQQRYPDAVHSGLLLDILALHTTSLGTADQCTVEQMQQHYDHQGTQLPELLQLCQDLHLLTVTTTQKKQNAKTTRLAHDTLAPLVREQFEVSDKPGQRARRILDNRAVDWEHNQRGQPLDANDLSVVEVGTQGTRAPSDTEGRLILYSQQRRANAKRWRRVFQGVGILAIALIAASAVVSYWFSVEARDARVAAEGSAKTVTRQLALAERDSAFQFRDDHDNWTMAAHLFQKSSSVLENPRETSELNLAARSLTKTLRLQNVIDFQAAVDGVRRLHAGDLLLIWGQDKDGSFLETRDANTGQPAVRQEISKPLQILFPKDGDRLICIYQDKPPELIAVGQDGCETLATAPVSNAMSYTSGTLCGDDQELMISGIPVPYPRTTVSTEAIWNWRFNETPTEVTDLTREFKQKSDDREWAERRRLQITSVHPDGRSMFVQSTGAYLLRKNSEDRWETTAVHFIPGYSSGFLLAPEIAICFYRVDNAVAIFDVRSGEATSVDLAGLAGRRGKLNPDGRTVVISGDEGTAGYSVAQIIEAIDQEQGMPEPLMTGSGVIGAISTGGTIEIAIRPGQNIETKMAEKIRCFLTTDSSGIIHGNQSEFSVNTELPTISSKFLHDDNYLLCLTGEADLAEFDTSSDVGGRMHGVLKIFATDGRGQAAFSIRHQTAIKGYFVNQAEDRICTWSDDGQVRVWKFEPDAMLTASSAEILQTQNGNSTSIITETQDDSPFQISNENFELKVDLPGAAQQRVNFAFWDAMHQKLLTIEETWGTGQTADWRLALWSSGTQQPDVQWTHDDLPLRSGEELRSACLSADGKTVIVSTGSRILCLDSQTAKLLGALRAYSPHLAAKISPDRKQIAVWGVGDGGPKKEGTGDLRIWDLQTLQPITEVLYHERGVRNVWFDESGKYVFASSTHTLSDHLNVWSLNNSRRVLPIISIAAQDVIHQNNQTTVVATSKTSDTLIGYNLNLQSDEVTPNDLQYWTGTRLNDVGEIEYLTEQQWRTIQAAAEPASP